MRRVFLAIICLSLGSVFSAVAQDIQPAQPTQPTAEATPTVVVAPPKTDWLVDFRKVKVDGPMNVVLKHVSSTDEVRIVYDTKGCITSKFKAEIDKSGVLVVEEKYDPKRTTVTDVTIYYTTLNEVKIAHAKADFEDTIDVPIFDITASGGAVVKLNLECLDVAVECTGRTLLTLTGKSRYMTLRASSAKVNCSKFYTVSSTVDVSHSSEVRINVSERLEATTSTGAKLIYKGRPTILRDHTAIFGGDIINIDD